MMPDTEVLPSRDLIAFQLFDWLAVGEEDEHETLRAMMDVSQRLAADMFLPHCRQSDIVEPRLDADGVHILPAIREALTHFAELGLFGAGFPEKLGGLGLEGHARHKTLAFQLPPPVALQISRVHALLRRCGRGHGRRDRHIKLAGL